jgi:hypothetical protein
MEIIETKKIIIYLLLFSFCHHLVSVVRRLLTFRILIFWNLSGKWTETWYEASMEDSL